MITGPLSLQPIAHRLRAQAPAFGTVGTARDVQAVQLGQAPTPCAFVILGTEQAGPRTGGSDAFVQRMTATIGVLVGVLSYADEAGGDAINELTPYLTACRQALIGWRHPDAQTIFEMADARLLAMDESGVAWWMERYRCDYWLTTNP